ncbi:MAG: amidohydrolase, partial [Candidatus Cloacimonetes bacterium]|nr:amidohydrolase [Candidatus Cloacimonadota bacterium]
MPALSLTELRHRLHACAELSGEESRTAALLCQELEHLKPDRLVRELGGHGLVAIFDGPLPGPRVLLRADMDALP